MEDWIPEKLKEIAYDVAHGESNPVYTPRQILEWFGSQRRGWRVKWTIREALKELGLRTDPDFSYAYIDTGVRFKLVEEEQPQAATSGEQSSNDDPLAAVVVELVGTAIEDPTYRIGKLQSANTPPTSVNPNATVEQAITLMLLHDFSQLPVMQSERSLKGAVTWQSIGKNLVLGKPCASVQDCMDEPAEISSETSLFAAIPPS